MDEEEKVYLVGVSRARSMEFSLIRKLEM